MKQHAKNRNHIAVFEHEILSMKRGPRPLTSQELKALQLFHAAEGHRYYQLIYQGVRFKSYVGVLQLGSLTISILPKTDREVAGSATADQWQTRLIGMLRAVGAFKTFAPTSSALNLKANHLLDLYFELFVSELEFLYRKGLIKQYRKVVGNQKALKGKLLFSKQLQKNLVHQERFFVQHSKYDQQHLLHLILYKALRLLHQLNQEASLSSRIGHLLLHFPEMPDLKVSERLFARIKMTRKTTDYEPALKIAQLLLLNYHPDLQGGHQHVLALLFNMNRLWERFLYISLHKACPSGWSIDAQDRRDFWKQGSDTTTIRPDLVLSPPSGAPAIIDTKWKDIGQGKPSASDLQQLFAYLMYYRAAQVALVYPGNRRISQGHFQMKSPPTEQFPNCSVLCIPPSDNIQAWQAQIAKQIFQDWIQAKSSSKVQFYAK